MTEDQKAWLSKEVQRQLEPVATSVIQVKKLNEEQSKSLAKLVQWQCEVWGNGSGNPGYLERRFAELFEVVNEVREKVYREEGKEQLRLQIAAQKVEANKIADAERTNRLLRRGSWITIGFTVGGSFMGAWLLSLVRPLAKELMDHLMKVWR